MAYRIVVTLPAADDLREIFEYISRQNFDAAHRVRLELVNAVKLLAGFARAGRILPKINDPTVREIVRRPYRIIYRINEADQTIEVLRFWHAARGAPKI